MDAKAQFGMVLSLDAGTEAVVWEIFAYKYKVYLECGDKKKVELYCIDGSTETLKDLKKVLKDWDLADFIKIISITSKEVSNYSYQLTFADGKLTLCNSTQQLLLFD